jgi:5-methyltetrahydrofolate--homocysteine methyltransferase
MSDRLARLLATRPWLLADGATGSNLFAEGLVAGDAPELWNVAHPDRIATLHRRFIDAGADIILTNSFGGNRYRLALHRAEARVAELNEAAARIARRVADESGREVVVAGSMGPTGEIMAPVGTLGFEGRGLCNRRRTSRAVAPTCSGSRRCPRATRPRRRSPGPRPRVCRSSAR